MLKDQIIHIILVGCDDFAKLDQIKTEQLGGKIYQALQALKADGASVFSLPEAAHTLALGLMLASYKFDKYKTVNEEGPYILKQCDFITDSFAKSAQEFEQAKHVQEAVFFARDLVSEVPNVLTTQEYVNQIQKHLAGLNIEIEVLNEEQMKELGMNAILGVGQGSSSESKLVVMKYHGGSKGKAPVAFVGKGVVFDAGGISLKPASNMHEMKYDMAGSASVVGALKALASQKSKVNVVGVVALVENMPDGNAQRPGDIVKTMSGQTVEVLNTDAEGRLVLADALWYTQHNFAPELIVDLATLTGAIVVALGNTFAGCFSNNDELAEKLIAAGAKVDEKLWRMPMHPDYDKMIKSEVGDWANIGNVPGAAGSAMGAHFLEKFINKLPWAHLDIAGLAWEKRGKDICPKGATGYGVRLLTQFVEDNYEEK